MYALAYFRYALEIGGFQPAQICGPAAVELVTLS